MRAILLATGLLVACATAASADDSLMTPRFGNTTISKSKGGLEAHLYFNADHTFTGKVIGIGMSLNGTWEVDGANICMTYNPAPPGMSNPNCTALTPHEVGDSWQSGDRTVSIVAGIQ